MTQAAATVTRRIARCPYCRVVVGIGYEAFPGGHRFAGVRAIVYCPWVPFWLCGWPVRDAWVQWKETAT